MTKPNLTEIVCVLDRSGSMVNIRADMEGAFNTFIVGQREVPGECAVTLVRFDDQYESVYQAMPIQHVPPLQIVPRNSTALFDAVGRAISDVGARLAATPEHDRPGRVVFIIITDGQENASREFSRERVFNMITHQREKYQWQFMFMGADQDAYAAAGQMGIAAGAVMSTQSTPKSARASFSAANAVLRSYRTGEDAAFENVGEVYLNCLNEEEKKTPSNGVGGGGGTI